MTRIFLQDKQHRHHYNTLATPNSGLFDWPGAGVFERRPHQPFRTSHGWPDVAESSLKTSDALPSWNCCLENAMNEEPIMTFEDAKRIIMSLLQEQGRATNSAMRRAVSGNTEFLEEVCEELVIEELARDKDGKGLIWIGPVSEKNAPGKPVEPVQARSSYDEAESGTADMYSVKKRIFISYGHDAHAELARQLKADLEEAGHTAWFDESDIKHGNDWEIAIEDGISGTHVVLAMMTPHAVRRPDGVCLDELSYARFQGKSIIPLMVQDCQPPLSISRLQWLDMQDWDASPERYQQKLALILDAIEGRLRCFEGSQTRLLDELRPINFRAEIDESTRGFFGRQWVFAEIEQWLDDESASRVFFLTGDPGVGKTAIAAMLCHKHPSVVAYHLCRHGDTTKSDALKCVLSLAYQLSSQLPHYRERLLTLRLNELEGKTPLTVFDEIVVQPLADHPAPDNQKMVVIDALDEATHDGVNELSEFLADAFERTPPWLRLFITSRPERVILDTLSRYRPRQLDTSDPQNLRDIRKFLQQRLAEIACGPVRKEIIEAILERSEGIFLYVKIVLDDLREGRLSVDRPEDFPLGLRSVFVKFFNRQFADPDPDERCRKLDDYARFQRPLLELVTAAREPLEVAFIRDVLQWDPYAKKRCVDPLGSLFITRGGRLLPFHRTIMDWLTDENTSLDFFIDRQQGNRKLVEYGWRQKLSADGNWHEYVLKHLPYHLAQEGRASDLRTLLTDMSFLECKSDAGYVYELIDDLRLGVKGGIDDKLIIGWQEFVTREAHALIHYANQGCRGFLQQAGNRCVMPEANRLVHERLAKRRGPWVRHENPIEDKRLLSVSAVTGAFLKNHVFSLEDVERWQSLYDPVISRVFEEWRSSFFSYGEPLPESSIEVIACFSSTRFAIVAGSGPHYSDARKVALLDTATEEVLNCAEVFGLTELGRCYAFSPDGKLLAVGCGETNTYSKEINERTPDASVRLYDGNSCWTHTLTPNCASLLDLELLGCAFNEDGSLCAFGDSYSTLHVVDVQEKRLVTSVKLGISEKAVKDVLWQPGGKWLFALWHEEPILVNWTDGPVLRLDYKGVTYRSKVSGVFDRSGECVVLCGGNYIGVWNVESGEMIHRLEYVADQCCFLRDEDHLALWNKRSRLITVIPWANTEKAHGKDEGQELPPLKHDSDVLSVSYSPRLPLFASVSQDGLFLLDTESQTTQQYAAANHILWLDANSLVAVDKGGITRAKGFTVDAKQAEVLRQWEFPESHRVDTIASWRSEMTFATASGDDQTVRLWEGEGGDLQELYRLHGYVHSKVRWLSCTADSRCVACAGGGRPLGSRTVVWDLDSLQVIYWREGAGTVAHFFRTRPYFLVGPVNGQSRYEFCDLVSSKVSHVDIRGDNLTFSPDDGFVATAEQNVLRIYDCSRFELQAMHVAEAAIRCMCWHEHSQIAVGCEGGKVEILTPINLPKMGAYSGRVPLYAKAISALGFEFPAGKPTPRSYGPGTRHSGSWFRCIPGPPMDREFVCTRCGEVDSFPRPRYTSCPACGPHRLTSLFGLAGQPLALDGFPATRCPSCQSGGAMSNRLLSYLPWITSSLLRTF